MTPLSSACLRAVSTLSGIRPRVLRGRKPAAVAAGLRAAQEQEVAKKDRMKACNVSLANRNAKIGRITFYDCTEERSVAEGTADSAPPEDGSVADVEEATIGHGGDWAGR
jgi:hypothetical protein